MSAETFEKRVERFDKQDTQDRVVFYGLATVCFLGAVFLGPEDDRKTEGADESSPVAAAADRPFLRYTGSSVSPRVR